MPSESFREFNQDRTELRLILVTAPPPFAVLWDMDGTIIDTEPLWMQAEADLVTEFGGFWSHEQALRLVGNGLMVSAQILIEAGVRLPAPEIVERLTDSVTAQLAGGDLPWRPGAVALIRALRSAGIQTALVTMSYRRMAARVARSLDELLGERAFDVIVCGDEVARPKPDAQAYLLAMEKLGILASQCIAVEDSPAGVASAMASGATTIAVPFLVEIPPRPGLHTWRSLEGRAIPDFEAALHKALRCDRTVVSI